MSSKTLEKLSKIISASSISLSDQNDLLVFLPIFPENVLEELVKIFEKNPKFLREFNENFKAKLDALAGGREAWEKIIAEEEKIIEKDEEEF